MTTARAPRIVGVLLVLLLSGCASVMPPPPVAPSPAASPPIEADAVAPIVQPAAPPSPPAPTAGQDKVATIEPPSVPATAPPANAPTGPRATIKAPAPATKAPPPAPAGQAAKKEVSPPVVAKPKAPPLDLAALEAQLKETKAIGVLTKIALKNQVDDLLSEFRAYYQGKLKTTLTELRRAYDLLVLKVLALLQDGDPPLASAIAASREAIWGILADPAKFATI